MLLNSPFLKSFSVLTVNCASLARFFVVGIRSTTVFVLVLSEIAAAKK